MNTAAFRLFYRMSVVPLLLSALNVFAQATLPNAAAMSDFRLPAASTGLRLPVKEFGFGYGREPSGNPFFEAGQGFLPGEVPGPSGGFLLDPLAQGRPHGFVRQNFSDGWGLGLGLRRSEYSFSNVISVQAERVWSNFRGSYTLYPGRPDDLLSEVGHRLQLSYQYDDRNAFGLSYINGRDFDVPGSLRGMAYPEVQGWSLGGKHWLTPSTALTYDLVQQELGAPYRRQSFQLGVRRNF